MHITAQGPHLHCVEWDVKLYYTIRYPGGAAILKLKALHEKTPGVRNPCSFRTAYTDAGGLRLK